jgi:hypothetical protein
MGAIISGITADLFGNMPFTNRLYTIVSSVIIEIRMPKDK